MGIIGYVSVCVLLYSMLVFHCWTLTTCFGLLGYLHVCTRLLIFKESASLHVSRLCFVPVLFSFMLFVVFLVCVCLQKAVK
jgi:Na+/pantothenate symporter